VQGGDGKRPCASSILITGCDRDAGVPFRAAQCGHALAAARAAGVRHIVHLSAFTVLGGPVPGRRPATFRGPVRVS
jgi:uncharacterized protein YbjT (DUF2867 family)